jgi:PhnB protein
MAVKAVPEGYHTATPYLIVDDAARALEYYRKAFGAAERMRFAAPGGKIGHAEFMIGNSAIMLADEHPEMGYRGPRAIGGTPVSIHLYVDNVDEVFPRAIAAGGTVLQPVKDQFYGDRSGTLRDPFGHVWNVATHKEDLSPEEMHRRAQAAMKQHAGA